MTAEDFITLYSPAAINESASSGMPASVIMAQALIETNNGNSTLFLLANNAFGIKCAGHTPWTGDTFYASDDLANECFRKYPTVADSFADHTAFLHDNGNYASLWSLSMTDYVGWAQGLKAAGYATAPGYADDIIAKIQQYGLDALDKKAQNQKYVRLGIAAALVIAIGIVIYLLLQKK